MAGMGFGGPGYTPRATDTELHRAELRKRIKWALKDALYYWHPRRILERFVNTVSDGLEWVIDHLP